MKKFLIILSIVIVSGKGFGQDTNTTVDITFDPAVIQWDANTNDISLTDRDSFLRYTTNNTTYTLFSISNAYLSNDGWTEYVFTNNALAEVRYRISTVKQFRFSTKTGVMDEKDYQRVYFKTKTNFIKTWGDPAWESDDPDVVNDYTYVLSSKWATDDFDVEMYVMYLNEQASMSFYFTPPSKTIQPFVNYKGFDFRKATWGMSKDEVRLSEPFAPFRSTDKTLIYTFEWNNMSGYVIYLFMNNSLTNGSYYISQKHDNFVQHIESFGQIMNRLSEELDEPDGVKFLWKTNVFEINTDWYGIALKEKQLAFTYFWEKKKRHIDIAMFYEDDMPVITVKYSAIYKPEEETESEAETEAELKAEITPEMISNNFAVVPESVTN